MAELVFPDIYKLFFKKKTRKTIYQKKVRKMKCWYRECVLVGVMGAALIMMIAMVNNNNSLALNEYHTTEEIYQNMFRKIKHAHPYQVYDLTPSEPKEILKVFLYAPIKDPSEYKVRVAIVCGQHGRELVSSELCDSMIKLLQNKLFDEEFSPKMSSLMNNSGVGFYIIPVNNPWGRITVERNDNKKCQRTNMNGVDLNRNFNHKSAFEYLRGHRSKYVDAGGGPEDNPGKYAMSEPETEAVSTMMSWIRPHVVINVHSGGNYILMPYDSTFDKLPHHYTVMHNLARHTRDLGCPECSVGTGSVSLYPAFGTLVDYAVDFMSVQIAYTFEIYASKAIKNDHELTNEECDLFFNPREGEELEMVLRKWINMLFIMFNRLFTIIA